MGLVLALDLDLMCGPGHKQVKSNGVYSIGLFAWHRNWSGRWVGSLKAFQTALFGFCSIDWPGDV